MTTANGWNATSVVSSSATAVSVFLRFTLSNIIGGRRPPIGYSRCPVRLDNNGRCPSFYSKAEFVPERNERTHLDDLITFRPTALANTAGRQAIL